MPAPQTNYNKANIVIPDTPNTKMFRDLFRTDPNATKPFQVPGGFRGTSIDPAWRWMRLTEYFGPCGEGWGAEQLAYEIAEGVAFVCMRLWYRKPNPDGTMGTGEKLFTAPQWGGSPVIKIDRSGNKRISDEALKMAATDAMGKCAGMFLGLGGDVYLGSFEDDKYREESEVFYQNKGDPDFQQENIDKFGEFLGKKLKEIETQDDLNAFFESQQVKPKIAKIRKALPEAGNRLLGMFTAKKNEIIAMKKDDADAA